MFQRAQSHADVPNPGGCDVNEVEIFSLAKVFVVVITGMIRRRTRLSRLLNHVGGVGGLRRDDVANCLNLDSGHGQEFAANPSSTPSDPDDPETNAFVPLERDTGHRLTLG